MANPDSLKPFKKNDPRINRNGRPKSFDGLRKLAQQLLDEVATNKHGEELVINDKKVTQVEAILRRMISDKKQSEKLLEIAYGKVPDEVNAKGEIIVKIKREDV